ncbi:MAG TPA: hypothetical protein VKV29_09195 [Chthonomonas sp.]|jgi:hypothetical protein|uniref:hypothetical protein n=1 Tax=Chthonomonas sp. TaxID=2282153 RepID=UPI002B4AC3EB|nr:hypothetical protein [Chthonomonas sp.]HLH80444.1 hypothetical protein [Chthonomonas sp.]
MLDNRLIFQTIKQSGLCAGIAAFGLIALHSDAAAAGFVMGSGLALFGLYGLERASLRCFHTNSSSRVGRIMGAALLFRLPVYVGGILLLMHFYGGSYPLALGGIGGILCVLLSLIHIVLKTVSQRTQQT